MTTISGSTSALSSLVSLYAGENAKSGSGSGDSLSSGQVSSLVGTIEGGSSAASTNLDALLGQSPASATTGSTELNAILDEIAAQKEAKATASDSSGTATTQQQKAASLMQSVYQSQASNLFTLLG